MRLTDDGLRRLYGEGAGEAAASAGGCPDPETMVRWVEGESEAGERLRVADHVASCAQCWQEVEAMRVDNV